MPAGYGQEEPGMGIGLTPPSAYGQIPSISERLLPRFTTKSFTFFVSVVDVLMFIVTLIYAGINDKVFDENNDMAGPSALMLFRMGGKWAPCIRAGEIYRLVTPIFLHAGIIHLVSNLFFQLYFGFTFEKRWGTARFIMVYMATGIGASLLSTVTGPLTAPTPPDSVSVGASGALFGLLGADIIYLFMNWNDIPQNKQEACVLTFVVVINFVLGFGSGGAIDNFAHLGGLLTGVFCGTILCPAVNNYAPRPILKLYKGIGTFLWVVFFVTLLLLIYLAPLNMAQCEYMYA